MSAYLWVILGSFLGPLVLSFDKKVHFYTYFPKVFISTLCVAIPFIIWDIYFTANQVWGFTPEYLAGIYLYNLPIEECLFFIIVPFACLFIHQVLKAYFPTYNNLLLARIFAIAFTASGFIFGSLNIDNWYTMSACFAASLLTIGFYFVARKKWYTQFAFTYLVVLIPFIIVNGILTGAITEKPIVWYSEHHIIGWRIITIPFEDLYYNYALLLPIVAIFEKLSEKTK